MSALILQTGGTQAYADYVVLLGVTSVAMVLGLFIVFQAYRGYRRNDSRRMLFLALGLALLTVAPFAVSIAVASVGRPLGFGPRIYTFFLPVASRLLEIAGLACLLYSLRIRK